MKTFNDILVEYSDLKVQDFVRFVQSRSELVASELQRVHLCYAEGTFDTVVEYRKVQVMTTKFLKEDKVRLEQSLEEIANGFDDLDYFQFTKKALGLPDIFDDQKEIVLAEIIANVHMYPGDMNTYIMLIQDLITSVKNVSTENKKKLVWEKYG